jgi:hypothetical protein
MLEIFLNSSYGALSFENKIKNEKDKMNENKLNLIKKGICCLLEIYLMGNIIRNKKVYIINNL